MLQTRCSSSRLPRRRVTVSCVVVTLLKFMQTEHAYQEVMNRLHYVVDSRVVNLLCDASSDESSHL